MQTSAQILHKVRGSVEVAQDLIDRSVTLYGTGSSAREQVVLKTLIDAAEALRFVAGALEDELVGPAA